MSETSLRVIFAGTPDFAALHLKALIESKHQLLAVYTQPDRRAGRGKKIQASPVKQLAQTAGVAVFQPPSLKPVSVQEEMARLGADVMIVVAYGLILPQAVLQIPRRGCLNVHASLLPRWRGAAPIQRAIEAGDDISGITIMQMDAGLDTGDMLATIECPVGNHTAASLHDQLADMGPPLLLGVLDDLENHQQGAQAQNDAAANYADKILKSEALIDWHSDVQQLERQIRAFNPFPVCYSILGGNRVKIWAARPLTCEPGAGPPGTIVRADANGIAVNCGNGQMVISKLQLPGAKALTAQEVLNARKELFAPGARFTNVASSASE